jgi:transaldolase
MSNKKRLIKGKLLVDTGDPKEAKKVQQLLEEGGFAGVDGATTNPSYFAKNPDVQARIAKGEKFTTDELLSAYKKTVQELDRIIPGGDISVEVYADQATTAEQMVEQAREMFSWIPTARIKLPITEQGLIAAETLKDSVRLNMTLCFSQQQAAAVYAITQGAKEPAFISPFIGRFDDRGENGAQFVGNVVKMMHQGDGHVEVLAASFRSVDNIFEMINVEADVVTINLGKFQAWADEGWKLPSSDFRYNFDGKDIPYEEIQLGQDWKTYDIHHELTDVGLKQFVDDWNNLLVG